MACSSKMLGNTMKTQVFLFIKSFFSFFLIVFFTQHSLSADRLSPSKVEGIWQTQKEHKNARIEVTRCAHNPGTFCGKIVWLEVPTYEDGSPKVDRNNPSAALADRPLLGLELLRDFKQIDDENWSEGTIYSPEEGETYDCTLAYVREDGQEKLDVRGYIGFSLFGKTQTWRRFSP